MKTYQSFSARTIPVVRSSADLDESEKEYPYLGLCHLIHAFLKQLNALGILDSIKGSFIC